MTIENHLFATLRPARAGDRARLRDLLRRSWLGTVAPQLPAEGRELFEAEDPAGAYVSAMWEEFQIAELDEVVVGMCHVQNDFIAAIHIEPKLKRQGIGRQLMKAAILKIAQDHGEARLEVLAFNTAARHFYAAQGWRDTRRFSGEELGCPVELIEMRLWLKDAADTESCTKRGTRRPPK